jgi:hypothetical protein
MKTGRTVSGGIYQKAEAGGSYGGFRLGYIKAIEQLPDGRQISGVSPDPERHHFVTHAFKLYDSFQPSATPPARSAPLPCSGSYATPTTPV